MNPRLLFLPFTLLFASLSMSAQTVTNNSPEVVVQRTTSPLIAMRFLFKTGAAVDPKGKEGVAALTASMLAEGGTKALAYEEIIRRMYPMATSFEAQVDKEMTVFAGATHVDNLGKYYGLVREMLLNPGFREEDFSRLKADAINFLKVNLREGNDEELGKERLYNILYAGHPYEHHNAGRVSSLEKLTLTDLKDFYRSNYTRGNLVIGMTGGLPGGFVEQVRKDFGALPAAPPAAANYAMPELPAGMRFDIVERETRSTAISLGFPIAVRRGHKDFPALALVSSWFGQHRSSNSHLYQRLREARGLNYGDYSYIEYFPRGMFQFQPDPNLGRQQQIFQIWIRPVPHEQAHFALRGALFEFDKLVKDGLTAEAFEATREFLTKYVNVLLQTQDDVLGYTLDSKYYGIGPYDEYLKTELAKLTLAEVNAAIKRHFKPDYLRVVMVTKNGKTLKEAILANTPSPMTYNSPKPQPILDEDKVISVYPITTKPEWVTVTPVDEVFQ